MGKVIAVTNQKGGVGKTTTAINLGASLAQSQQWTLVVDADPQANTTSGLGFHKDPSRRSLYHALLSDNDLPSIVLETAIEGLFLAPSEKALVGANVELVDKESREHILKRKLQELRPKYNYILIDCPPALDLLTLNALVAADSVIVPIQCEYFALEGVSELLDTLARIRRAFNPSLSIEGILLTMYDERTNLSRQVREDLQGFFGDKVFDTMIPRNVRLAEAPSHGKPVITYDPECRGSEAYLDLAKEVIHHAEKSAGARA